MNHYGKILIKMNYAFLSSALFYLFLKKQYNEIFKSFKHRD